MKMAVKETGFKGLVWACFERLNSKLFRFQVANGLIVPVVEFGEGLPSEDNPAEDVESDKTEALENQSETDRKSVV